MAIYFTQNTNSIEDIEQMNKVIEKVNNSNVTATVNISKLTDLNTKAEELSNNIQQALPVNSELKENIKIGQPLVQEVKTKNTELQASLEKAKKFIEGLDGSQNIPQLRLDVTKLQNGLKNNQTLAYTGEHINADNTLEGRTEGMVIKGKTSIVSGKLKFFGEDEKENDKYKISVLSHGKNLVDYSMFRASNETKIEINSNHIVLEGNREFANMSIKLSELNLIEGKTYYVKLDIENISGSSEAYYEIWINNKTTGKRNFTYRKGEEVSLFVFSNGRNFPSKNIIRNVIVSEKNEDKYESYKCDKKDILIKEPLRSKDDICDLLYEDNGQVKIDRYIGVRKHQEGDERNKEVLTDKINTVYILDKPVTEIVENCVDIDLNTFGEKTYFNILNSLPGTLDFKVPSNIASIVQNTAREVNNIWDVINNLLVPSLIDINKNVAMSTIKNNLK